MLAGLKHFGWGREGEGLTAEEEAFVMSRAEARFGTTMKESAPLLDTYRTMCLAPEPSLRGILERIRDHGFAAEDDLRSNACDGCNAVSAATPSPMQRRFG
jgi:hypothetical protein